MTPRDPAQGLAKARAPEGGAPQPGLCEGVDMRILRDGTWLYHGSPIARKPLVKLFSTALRREEDGSYHLVTPVERCPVTVDDAPFVAVEVDRAIIDSRQVLTFRTNVDDHVVADADHPIRVEHDDRSGEPSPYVTVRDGLDALIARPVYYELVALGVEGHGGDESVYGVWSSGRFFELGRLDRASAP